MNQENDSENRQPGYMFTMDVCSYTILPLPTYPEPISM